MFSKEAIDTLSQATAISQAENAVLAQLGHAGLIALPDNFTTHDLEKFKENRRRARGSMTTAALADFAAYTRAHAELGAAIFVQQADMSATAVLNLGTPEEPGHTDNRAKLQLNKTAAYKALQHTANGSARSQKEIAEFLEDWPGLLQFFKEGEKVSPPRAIAAIRKITIEAMRKQESTEQQLSVTRSALESVTASSTEPLPTTVYFKTVAFHGLAERTFVLRLSVHTGNDKPAVALRIVNQEQHDEEMATELAAKVREVFDFGETAGTLPVLVGTYTASI